MMLNRIAIAILALLLGTTGFVSAQAYGAPSESPRYDNEPDRAGWDVPPPNLTQTQANGFRDGVAAARDDIARHIQPNATARPEYRNPPQMPFLRRVMYRDGFQRGYQRGMDHFYGPPPPPPPPMPVAPPPMANPGDFMAFRHRGFQEGMDGALRDLDNHRAPDPSNRDEYRQPNVPYGMQEPYREGFRHGYERAVAALTDGPGRPVGPGREVRIRGFRDGAEGAIRDWDNSRRPDPNNRDEYRHPNNVPYDLVKAYRDGFQRGYRRISDELQGYFSRP